ncbi:MAG: ATP-binding protein [Gammaproteobacteria bacterium]|nr:MAG: ATP-binding protein [Gammaproteobacteria bacterium]
MSNINYFPTHLALGHAFCNRKEEIKRLTANIEGTNPVLIISPRRYGKTSLAINAFQHARVPFAHIDLYKELTEEDIQTAVLNGIGVLIGQFETAPKRLLKLATDLFSGMEVGVVLGKAGIKLNFNKRKKKAADVIYDSLEKLHQCAKTKKKKAILYMDEFQVLGEITKDHSIEAAIREAAQKSTCISYVFSGSNRHLMQQMFYDKKRPFYKLCDVIFLDRILEKDYEPFIQKAAIDKWNNKLPDFVLQMIFALTERHPYYVNKLCSLLWTEKYLEENIVNNFWEQYVLENRSLIEREIELLSLNQRKLLINLSNQNPTKEVLSKSFSGKWAMSPSSISQAISVLCEKDYLYVDKEGYYRILDPLVKSVLSGETNYKY